MWCNIWQILLSPLDTYKAKIGKIVQFINILFQIMHRTTYLSALSKRDFTFFLDFRLLYASVFFHDLFGMHDSRHSQKKFKQLNSPAFHRLINQILKNTVIWPLDIKGHLRSLQTFFSYENKKRIFGIFLLQFQQKTNTFQLKSVRMGKDIIII